MKARITSVGSRGTVTTVHFSCEAGEGAAVWKGTKIAPISGREYDAELDINQVLRVGENCTKEGDAAPSLKLLGEAIQVTGVVERCDDDGMIHLRLSLDSLVLVQSAGASPKPGEILRLVTPVEALQLSPIG